MCAILLGRDCLVGIAQAQLIRVGHVYVISNLESFGDDVFRVGAPASEAALHRALIQYRGN